MIETDAGGTPALPVKGNKYWHSRGYLPHCDVAGLIQSITFRLADALPNDVLKRLLDEHADGTQRHEGIEQWLDRGHGACWLAKAEIAVIVENALLHFDGQRYHLLE